MSPASAKSRRHRTQRPTRGRKHRDRCESSSKSAAPHAQATARAAEGQLRQTAGRFYCFPNISAYFGKNAGETRITDAVTFSAALLEQAHVAVVPGNDSGFDTHVRLSFATSMEQIDKGIDRIAEFLTKLG